MIDFFGSERIAVMEALYARGADLSLSEARAEVLSLFPSLSAPVVDVLLFEVAGSKNPYVALVFDYKGHRISAAEAFAALAQGGDKEQLFPRFVRPKGER